MKCEKCGHENKSFHRSGAMARWMNKTVEERRIAMSKVREGKKKI